MIIHFYDSIEDNITTCFSSSSSSYSLMTYHVLVSFFSNRHNFNDLNLILWMNYAFYYTIFIFIYIMVIQSFL